MHSALHTQAAFLASVWPTCLCLQTLQCRAHWQCFSHSSEHKQCAVCCAVWHNFVHSVRLSSGSTLWSQMGCMRLFRPPSQYWGILSKRDHRLILCTAARQGYREQLPVCSVTEPRVWYNHDEQSLQDWSKLPSQDQNLTIKKCSRQNASSIILLIFPNNF